MEYESHKCHCELCVSRDRANAFPGVLKGVKNLGLGNHPTPPPNPPSCPAVEAVEGRDGWTTKVIHNEQRVSLWDVPPKSWPSDNLIQSGEARRLAPINPIRGRWRPNNGL